MEEHRHHWSVVDFFVDDRPMMLQRCACGTERTIPAWDRYWHPDEASDVVAVH